MGGKSFSRLESSLAIDELLSLNDRRHPPNWLLTYIDVFVLIVMLVVTLVALSTFETIPVQTDKPAKIVVVKKSPQPIEAIKAKAEIQEHQAAEATPPPPIQPIEPTEPVKVEPATAEQSLQLPVTDDQPEASEGKHEPEATIETAQAKTSAIDADRIAEQDLQLQLKQQLENLGLTDSIHMTVTQGYAELEIQDNILYQSSEAALTETGRSVLTRLTPLLKQAKGLIYIEGHTDNRPIKTVQFPSNWELGAARATSVLHFLASQQITASRMRAVTYADSKPIADNTSEQGRQKNRRVNIVIKISDKVD